MGSKIKKSHIMSHVIIDEVLKVPNYQFDEFITI